MTQEDFLAQNVFNNLESITIDNDDSTLYFSEESFSQILAQAEHYGISIYEIKSVLDGTAGLTLHHEAFRKKATDANWYKKEFKSLKRQQEGYLYAATYKVSKKLLSR
ncbi:hypothetical protein [Wenyingzhuangia sp. IMCC45574]